MTNPINGLGPVSAPMLPQAPGSPAAAAANPGGVTFQDLLAQSLGQTSGLEQNAQDAIARSLAGEDITQVEVFSAVKQADMALRMMVQVRNKVLEAFNEVKNLRM